jgi:predicted GIY-YIG superfamily endonuclease
VTVESAKDALNKEKQIKKWSREKKLALADGNFAELRQLS